MREHECWYALTSGNNQGWDVHLFRAVPGPWTDVILIEVKTSVKQSITLSGSRFDQLTRYRDIWKREKIATFYAFRWITTIKKYEGKPLNELDKWKFFHIDDMKKTFKWGNGIPWKAMMRRLK